MYYKLNNNIRVDNSELGNGSMNLDRIYTNETNNIKETLFWFVK